MELLVDGMQLEVKAIVLDYVIYGIDIGIGMEMNSRLGQHF